MNTVASAFDLDTFAQQRTGWSGVAMEHSCPPTAFSAIQDTGSRQNYFQPIAKPLNNPLSSFDDEDEEEYLPQRGNSIFRDVDDGSDGAMSPPHVMRANPIDGPARSNAASPYWGEHANIEEDYEDEVVHEIEEYDGEDDASIDSCCFESQSHEQLMGDEIEFSRPLYEPRRDYDEDHPRSSTPPPPMEEVVHTGHATWISPYGHQEDKYVKDTFVPSSPMQRGQQVDYSVFFQGSQQSQQPLLINDTKLPFTRQSSEVSVFGLSHESSQQIIFNKGGDQDSPFLHRSPTKVSISSLDDDEV